MSVTVPADPIIRTTGPCAVFRGDVESPIVGELVQRVLVALCVSFPRSIETEQLASAVWVGARPESWKSSLRTHVSRLRDALEGPGLPEVLHDARGYSLSSVEAIDVVCVERWLAEAAQGSNDEGHSTSADAQRQLELADRIASLLVVDQGFSLRHHLLDAWLDRARLQQSAAVRLKFRALTRLGRTDEVLEGLLVSARDDLLDEALIELVVDVLLATERTGEAHEILARTRIRFDEHNRAFGDGLRSRQRGVLRNQASAPVLREPSSFTLFGGRERELAALRAAVQREDGIVLLSGDGGMGKSALISSFVAEHESQGGLVIMTTCTEFGSPGQAFLALLSSAAPNLIRPDLDQVEVMVLFVDSMSRRRPLIVVDDLHLIDLASAKSLRRLLRRVRGTTATVVLSFRPGAHPRFANEVIVDGMGSPGRVLLSLEPLSRDGIFEVLKQTMPGDTRMSRVWEQSGQMERLTGGVPLLVDLILSISRLDGFPSDLGHPENDETMLARMKPLVLAVESTLTEKQAETLAIGAVYGYEFDVSVAAELSGVSAADAYDGIDAAHRVGILERRNRNQVRFKHDLIRQTLLADRPTTWRCSTHRLIADAMTQRGLDPPLVCIHRASALLNSTSESDVIEVLELVQALKAQAQWGACTTALELCRENLESQPWLHSRPTKMRIFELLGYSYESTHDTLRSRKAFESAIEVADGNELDVARIAIAAAGSSQPIGGDDDRSNWLSRVMYSPTLPAMLRLEALAEYVYLQSLVAVSPDVERADAELLRLADEIGTDVARRLALHGHLVSMMPYPTAQERVDRCAPLIAHAQTGTRPDTSATLSMISMGSLLSLGEFGRAQESVEPLAVLAASLQRPADRWHILVNQALLLEWTGRSDEAGALADEALEVALRFEVHDGWLTFGSMHLGRALRDRSFDAFVETMLASAELDDEEDVTVAGIVMSLRLGLTDDRDAFVEGVRRLREEPRHLAWLGTVVLAADTNVALELPCAAELYELLLPFTNTIVVNGVVPASTFGPVDRYLADLANQMGDYLAARRFVEQANQLVERAGLVGWASA